jgi:hypothetical protein
MPPAVMEVPAVGQRIRVWWTVERRWYPGACVRVVPPAANEDPADPTVHIHYDDGVALQYSARHLASGKGWEAAGGPGRGEPAENVVARPPKQGRVASGQSLKDKPGWEAQMAKLKNYQAEHGDCMVPNRWAEDPGLGIWVKGQRERKKALDRGEPSKGMTAARAARLEALGFVWRAPTHGGCSNDAGWEARLAQLEAYKRKHSDCNVPRHWAEDPALGGWVDRQRKLKKRLDRGEPCEGMTAARAANLEALGFAWELSTGAQNTSHRTQADATAKAFEVDAVVDKRRYDKGV